MLDFPKQGEGVWHHEYGNGIIYDIQFTEHDVYVLFWRRTTLIGPRKEVFDLKSFECFSDRFNQWMMYSHPR